jgi:hypothetical protein
MHIIWKSINCLRASFPRHFISHFGDMALLSRCPDFFLWGYLKSKVHFNKLHTIIELKEHISDKIKSIDAALL